MRTISNYQADVDAFMSAGGQKVHYSPTPPSVEEQWRGVDMIQQEVNEMKGALAALRLAEAGGKPEDVEDALVEYADALGDIIYVAIGRASEAGIRIGPVLEEISRSNNSKINWEAGEPWVVHPSGKIAKDHHFSEPDLKEVMFG